MLLKGNEDETEIVSTYFETEEDSNDCVLEIRKANQRTMYIAETIRQLRIELNDILTVSY